MSISSDKGLDHSGATMIKPFIIAVFSFMNPEHNNFEFKIAFNSVLELRPLQYEGFELSLNYQGGPKIVAGFVIEASLLLP